MDGSDANKSNKSISRASAGNAPDLSENPVLHSGNEGGSSHWRWWPSAGRRFFFREPEDQARSLIQPISREEQMVDNMMMRHGFPHFLGGRGSLFRSPLESEILSTFFPPHDILSLPTRHLEGHFGCVPRIDMFDDGKNYVIRADLPGIKKEDVTVSVKDSVLQIHGENNYERTKNDGTAYFQERCSGSVFRSLTLPKGTTEDMIKANMEDGVLRVTVPKQEKLKDDHHSIPIE